MTDQHIRRGPAGNFEVVLEDSTLALIRHLCDELDALLDSDSALLRRLFPPPYGDDEERNEGYAALATPELIDHRRAALSVVRDSLGRRELSEEELLAWMRSINDLRLVLGTLVGIEDDDTPPTVSDEMADTLAVYEFLGMILEATVDALDS